MIEIDLFALINSIGEQHPETLKKLLTKLDPDYDYSEWGTGALMQAVILCYVEMILDKS